MIRVLLSTREPLLCQVFAEAGYRLVILLRLAVEELESSLEVVDVAYFLRKSDCRA